MSVTRRAAPQRQGRVGGVQGDEEPGSCPAPQSPWRFRRPRSGRRERVGTMAAALAGLSLLAIPCSAQVSTGTILGNVTDNTGAVAGAQVTATNLGTQFSRNTLTDAEGHYSLQLLPVGDYKVVVSLTG